MKLLFHSYSGATWGYDIHSRAVAPHTGAAAPDAPPGETPLFALQPFSDADLDAAWAKGIGSLILNVTEQCSNRCCYCVYGGAYAHERAHSQKVMPLETAIKGVEFYCRHRNGKDGALLLSFYGGEPMFGEGMERIRAVLAYVRQRHPEVRAEPAFTTNGNHLTEANCRFLIENDFQVMVSLDGPEDIHNRYRVTQHGQPTFAAVMERLRRLRDLSPDYYARRVSFCAVLTPPLDYRRRSAFFREHPLTANHPLLVSNVSLYGQTLFDADTVAAFTRETIAATNEAAQTYYQAALRGEASRHPFENALFRREFALLGQPFAEGTRPDALGLMGCCVPGLNKCFVGTDGTLFACEKMQGYHPLGTLETGLDKAKLKALVRGFEALRRDRCAHCPYALLCSLCYVNAMDTSHSLSEECLDVACIERRSFFKVALRLWASLKEAGLPIPPAQG